MTRPRRCYIIAEAGSNHDGDLATALRLVEAAAVNGADAVKFQLFRAAELYPPNCGVVDTPVGPVDFFELLSTMELPAAWLPELAAHAEYHQVDFLCTPFSEDAVATLDAMDVPLIKVASPELTDHALLRAVAATGRPIVLSTGMSSLADVDESLRVLDDAGASTVTLLQCTTAYPTPPEDLHLGAIPVLATAFDRPVGLSDHSIDPVLAPSISIALGGTMIEKHLTLSRAEGAGPDHPFAIEPDELRAMVTAIRALEEIEPSARLDRCIAAHGEAAVASAIGPRRKGISPAEQVLAECDRRSIHATADIAVGDVLGGDNVRVLRGEQNLKPGLHPRHLHDILGARAQRPVAAGDGVVWDDLVSR